MTIPCSFFFILFRALLNHGNSPPRLLLSLLLIIITTFNNLPLSTAKTFPGDVEALRQLKAGVDPTSILPASCLSSWDFTAKAAADPCDSLFSGSLFTCGFRCDNTYSSDGLARVTEISLDPAGYSGTLSPTIWDLTFLESLEIPDNQFYGSIPSPKATASLPNLRRLSLSHNAFSGDIPPEVFSASKLPVLEELFLDGNHLTGTVPAGLPGMWTLKRLELQMNNLTGTLPEAGLSSLTSLYYLDASDNAIAGPVPSAMPPSLVELAMRNNMLDGPIPPALGELRYLQVLDLGNNRLSGAVPATLFANPSLQQLVLTQNRLSSLNPPRPPPTSQWPGSTGGGSCALVEIDLSHNDLAGTLPSWLSSIASLSALSLEGNSFSGIIPWGYAAKPFARLLLAGNYLYGPIPIPFTISAKASSAVVSLADNCLFRCPDVFFFCRGGDQKPTDLCRQFNPFIP